MERRPADGGGQQFEALLPGTSKNWEDLPDKSPVQIKLRAGLHLQGPGSLN